MIAFELAEQRPERAGGEADGVEVVARRIEIEDQPVGMLQPVGSGEPDVGRDAVLVGEVDERGRVVADRVLDGAALLVHRDPADPVGEVVGGGLLVEARPVDPVGKALHRDGPALHVRDHARRHAPVVLDQVSLRHPDVGKQHLVEAREGHRVAADPDLLRAAHPSPGCRHFVARLPATAPPPLRFISAREL